jgi:hypothetical protein
MSVPCYKVIRLGQRWGVTERSVNWVLAEFDEADFAVDYARALATATDEAILEREDERGRLEIRHVFSTDPAGLMRMSTVELSRG